MDIENKTMNLEDTADWTEEDFNRVVGEYQKRRKSIPNPTPNKKTGKTLKTVIGIGLLAGSIGLIYSIWKPVFNNYPRRIPNSYSTPEVRNTSGVRDVSEVKNYSEGADVHSPNSYATSQSDAIDKMLSGIEVFSDVTVGDIVGGSIKEFSENTAPEDMVKEITKGTIREMSKEVIETGREVVQEVLSDPDVSETMSEISNGLKSIFGK